MKKYLSCILCLALILPSICSCSQNKTEQTETSNVISESYLSEETSKETEEPPIETTEEVVNISTLGGIEMPEKKESHYTFKPFVQSNLMTEIMGENMTEAYRNLVDAIMNEEFSFECSDEDTFKWVMGQYPYLLFPVVAEYIQMDEYKDGVGYFHYTISIEEFREKRQEFEDIVVDILNSCLEDDYSDFEKALALYLYFIENYVYDYDTLYAMEEEYQEDISGYRLLTGGTGICQELSVAYSYLLLQAGVDATVIKGERGDKVMHQWSMVTINGTYYHVDPTYGLGLNNCINYFMMTDSIRDIRDDFDPEKYIPSTVYAQMHENPDFSVTDDTYSVLWGGYVFKWDPDKNEIYYNDDNLQEVVFNYGTV